MYLLIEFWRSEYKIIFHDITYANVLKYLSDNKQPAKQYFIVESIRVS